MSRRGRRPRRGGGGGARQAGGQDGAEKRRLQDAIMRLRGEINEELSQRAQFQLERDRIIQFWEVSKTELQTCESETRNKERELEEARERHEIEIKNYKGKLRHLLYEQKVTLDRLKIENENALKLQTEEYHQKHLQLKSDIRRLDQFKKQQELSHAEHEKEIKLANEQRMTELRDDFERELKQIQLRYQDKMKRIREEMEETTKDEVRRIEQDKNSQIASLMDEHTAAFEEIKKYFKGITDSNLHEVEKLNREVNIMKASEVKNEDFMFDIAQRNKNLSEPLMEYLERVNTLRQELANYSADSIALEANQRRLAAIEKNLQRAKWDCEILYQSLEQLTSERDELHGRYEASIHDVQQKLLFKNQLLEAKCHALEEEIEKKDIEIEEVVKLSNLAEGEVEAIRQGVE